MTVNKQFLNEKNKKQFRQKLILILVVLLMIPLFFVTKVIITGFTQTQNKDVKQVNKLTFENEPIEVLNVKNKQTSWQLGETFVQKSDWLKDFSIVFKNNSAKSISYLKIDLDFPETKTTGNIMAYPLSYGSNSAISVKNEKDTPIKSGENVELILTETNFEALKKFIETRHPLDSLTKMDIRIVFILFDDGTAWSSGSFMRPDPNNPKKFIPIEAEEREKSNEK